MIEPHGPRSHPAAPAAEERPQRGGPGRRRLLSTVAVLAGVAVLSGAIAAGVTLAVLRSQARTNPQELNFGSRVSITEENAAAQVAAKALPAVVSIVTQERGPAYGSGFLVTSDGYLVTNTAVIANASSLSVLVPADSRRRDARLVDFDCDTGLAVLKVDGVSNLPTLSFGDSSALKLGQTVVALAGPLEPRQTTSRGIVSALHGESQVASQVTPGRDLTYADTIQTDASIVPGSSGGPVLNVGGQVVGVALAGTSHGQPVSFALASNDVRPSVDQIVQLGQLQVASLDVVTTQPSPEEAVLKGTPEGALVESVQPGGPAAAAGLKPGDVVTQLDDAHVDSAHPLAQLLRSSFKPTQRVTVTYWRGGTTDQVQLTLRGEHPSCS